MRKFIRAVGLSLARIFGTRVIDVETGRQLDRALLIPWRGKIHVIGLKKNVRPYISAARTANLLETNNRVSRRTLHPISPVSAGEKPLRDNLINP